MKLGQILIHRELILPFQLEKIIKIQSLGRKKLGDILVTQGLIQSTDLKEALLEQYWRDNGFWVID